MKRLSLPKNTKRWRKGYRRLLGPGRTILLMPGKSVIVSDETAAAITADHKGFTVAKATAPKADKDSGEE